MLPSSNGPAKLICTTPEFDDLAREVIETGFFKKNPVSGPASAATIGVTAPAQRAQLRAELDGLIAHVYRLTEAKFSHILGTFPLVAAEVKAALGEYRRIARDGGMRG